MSTYKNLMTVCAAVVLAFGLAACGSDGEMAMEPTPQEMCEADGGRYNADMTCTSAADLAVEAEVAAIAMAIADAKAAADALTASSSTADVDAAEALVMAAHEAITGAMHATAAQTAASLAALDAVRMTVSTADEAVTARLAEESATMERATMQMAAIMTAAGNVDTSNLMTQADIDAAEMAIAALKAAIALAVDVADTSMYQTMVDNAEAAVMTAQTAVNLANDQASQMMALSDAATALETALAAISGTPTQAQIDDAQTALDALNAAIMAAGDLDDTSMYAQTAANAEGQIATATKTLAANMDREAQEEADRIAAEEAAERQAAEEAAAAMAVTASKLYAGISAPGGAGDAIRNAAHDTDGNIEVTIGTAAAVDLTEDEDATVAARHGWTGMMFKAEPDGDVGTYEAVVYSNVGEPTEGAMFNDTYTLDTDDQIADVTSVTDYAGLVDSPSFDQGAGTKTFDLAENREYLEFAGTFNGVPGTYTCTPTAIATDRDTCGSTVAASGFTLIGGTWMFEPNNPEQRLMDMPDAIYASYGWWLHKSEDGETFTASAFAANRGDVPAASSVGDLMGSATYMGGAAGKYALHSTTGGTNDAGHFTADVELTADFNDDMIEGTIDNFIGADGQSRDWSVKLNETDIGDTGVIDGLDATSAEVGTVWTMGGEAADESGQWRGALYENDATSGVPQVATGTFYSEFGRDGKMVGGFGANAE